VEEDLAGEMAPAVVELRAAPQAEDLEEAGVKRVAPVVVAGDTAAPGRVVVPEAAVEDSAGAEREKAALVEEAATAEPGPAVVPGQARVVEDKSLANG
jgi:hypothetical protein